MKRAILFILTLSLTRLAALSTQAAEAQPRMLAHDVYFALKDHSEKSRQQLVQACKKYLSDHPGTVWFDAAVIVEEHKRDVNDRDFDVALHVLFKDKASHNAYQTASRHLQFIAENKDRWQKVRVFDSWIMTTAHPDMPAK